jgi:multiple sugar transport system ATP-binding protein
MTVYQNMSYALKVAKEQKTVIDEKVKKVADILQLSEYLNRKPKELSGGQRQRVAIGRAIVREPKVFLFDEPLSNLDAKLRVQMRIELTKLHKKLKTTMVYVTHDQVEAMTMADKIVVINNGKVEQVGAPLELYRHPSNQFVAGFIGSPAMNFFPGIIKDVTTKGIHFELNNSGTSIFLKYPDATVSIGESIQFGVRPEHFIFTKKTDQIITGEVYAVERLGGETYIYLSSDTDDDIIVHCNGDREIKIGEKINVGFSIKDCHLFNSKGWAIR